MFPFLIFKRNNLKRKAKLAQLKIKMKKRLIKKLKSDLKVKTADLEASLLRESEFKEILSNQTGEEDKLKKLLSNSFGVEELLMEENAHLMEMVDKLKEEKEKIIEDHVAIDFEIFRYRILSLIFFIQYLIVVSRCLEPFFFNNDGCNWILFSS